MCGCTSIPCVLLVYDFNDSLLDVQPHVDVMASLLFVNINLLEPEFYI